MAETLHAPVEPDLALIDRHECSVHAFSHGYPSHLIRWHCHDEYELHLVLESEGKMFVGDHVGRFAPGQLVLTGPRLPHNWISHIAPDETIERRGIVVQFRDDLVSSMLTAAPELRALLPLLERARFGIEFEGAVRDRARDWFDRMLDASGPHRIALLLDFLTHLAEADRYALLSTMPMRSDADDALLDKIGRVTQYVDKHHDRDIALATVAQLVGMSESGFSRMFTKATGNSFSRFLIRVRIAKACELLADSDEPITDICFRVGFNNVANFNRRFRELKSVTPSEYRRLAQLRHKPLLNRADLADA